MVKDEWYPVILHRKLGTSHRVLCTPIKAGLHPWSAGRQRDHFMDVENETANRSELSLSIKFLFPESFECGFCPALPFSPLT
jgi:hypothetical protein